MAAEMAAEISQAVQLGGRNDRGDPQFLQAAAAASQASEVDQHAGTVERGAQTPNPCRTNLSQCRELSPLSACLGGGVARKLDRSHTVLEHGSAQGASERNRSPGGGGVTSARHPRLAYVAVRRVNPVSMEGG